MIRVLILDDDKLFGKTLAGSLRRNPELAFAAIATSSAEEALAAVQNSAQPIDVFLIDQRLGPGPDGITVFQELRRHSPDSEGIIFTGIDDTDAGLRAYQAGAYRYLPKPFDTHDLVWMLRSLCAWRDAQYERDWLKVLTEIAKETQRALLTQEVADVVVRGGLRLGFERARFWEFSPDGLELIGKSDAGAGGGEGFPGFVMLVNDSPYAQRSLAQHGPLYFQGQELGPSYHDQQLAERGFKPPVGEWVEIALWAGDRCLGLLVMDNSGQARSLRPEQRSLLGLFGEHVAATLDRARLYELELRKSKEVEVLNQIARRVTARAAVDDLDTLLQEVRTQIATFMDVRNFRVALLDQETGQLDVRLHVEEGKPRRRYQLTPPAGLIGHCIEKAVPLHLEHGERAYCKAEGIRPRGRATRCWLSVPLLVNDHAMGAIAVYSYEQTLVYREDDLRLLTDVANQVAGVIQTALLKEQKATSARQLTVLHRASTVLMQLAEAREDWLWHTMLTMTTAAYGLRFNRAVLFLTEEGGPSLHGRLGIGYFDRASARRAWRKDIHEGLDFDGYLSRLQSGHMHSTPVEKMARDLIIDRGLEAGAFAQVLREGQRVVVPAKEAIGQLPARFAEQFGPADYAVLPLRAGSKMLGLVVVDNSQNGEPLRAMALDHLETLLTQAALACEAHRQRRSLETILAAVNDQPLQQTLSQLCEMAQAVTGADLVLIFPLKPDVATFEFDGSSIGRAGEVPEWPMARLPGSNGLTMQVLRTGLLAVPNVAAHRHRYNGRKLVEHAVSRDGIKAFIGTPIKDERTGGLLGVLYLDYRAPREFDKQDIASARLFAHLAAGPIRRAAIGQETQLGLAKAEAQRRDKERELTILRRVLEQSLTSDPHEGKTIRSLLNAAQDLLQQPDIRVGLLLREWTKPEVIEQEPQEVRYEYYPLADESLSVMVEQQLDRGITGQALDRGHTLLVPDVGRGEWADYFYDTNPATTRSELDVPVRLGEQVIGVFNVESSVPGAFNEAHQATMENLAAAATLALDNVRRQAHLHGVLTAARTVTTASSDLKETLQAILRVARDLAPGLSTLTLWYREPETGRIVLGPYFGVHDESGMRQGDPAKGTVVWEVMHAPDPIWATHVPEEPRLKGRYIVKEGIRSAAGLPLQAGGELIGALFFSYRQRHEFSAEERTLFPILAEIAAASIRDAAQVETMNRHRRRLEAAMRITEAVGATLDLDQTLREILTVLRKLFPHATPCVLLYNVDAQALEFGPASLEFYHIDNPKYQNVKMRIDEPSLVNYVACQALSSKQVQSINVGNVLENTHYVQHVIATRSELCVSLMQGERLLGILELESRKENAFDEDDKTLIERIGQQVSVVIERAQQSEQLRLRSIITAHRAWARDLIHYGSGDAYYIRSQVDWLQQDENNLSQKGRRILRAIDETIERLVKRIKDDTLWRVTPPEAIDVDNWLDQNLAGFVQENQLRSRKSIRLLRDGDSVRLRAYLHPRALESVIRELVSNAVEAMHGRGKLIIRTREVDGQRIEVQVEDSGPGVPENLRPMLFQGPSTTHGAMRGSGLLFIRATIEEMGGHISLLPQEPGHGAVFVFTLPAAPNSPDKEG